MNQVEDVGEPFVVSLQQHPYLRHCLLSWLQLFVLSESALLKKENVKTYMKNITNIFLLNSLKV